MFCPSFSFAESSLRFLVGSGSMESPIPPSFLSFSLLIPFPTFAVSSISGSADTCLFPIMDATKELALKIEFQFWCYKCQLSIGIIILSNLNGKQFSYSIFASSFFFFSCKFGFGGVSPSSSNTANKSSSSICKQFV